MPRFAVLVTVLVALLIGLMATGIAGEVLSLPAPATIGAPPAGLPAESVLLHGADGAPVAGWMVRGRGSGAVLLLHGVRGDRREMVDRAQFLHRLGYSVLLIDLPAHGESTAEHITYGANEAVGVRAALAYLASACPGERIGVIGVSLGAASFVLSRPSPAPSAVVVESMFPTIDEAVEDRLALHAGPWARPFAPLLLWQLPLRLHVDARALRPIDALPLLQAPVLIVAGAADRHTTLPETLRLYGAASARRQLWIVDGAAHVDLHAYAPAAYEARIGAFLAQNLRPHG